MAFTNDTIIRLINIVRNRDLNGEDVRPSDFQTLINKNSLELFSAKIKELEAYRKITELGVVSQTPNQKAIIELRPFLERKSVSVVGGEFNLKNNNIFHLVSLENISLGGRGFTELNEFEISEALNSAVIAPTESDPAYYLSTNKQVVVIPSSISSLFVVHYRKPSEAVVVYDIDPVTLRKVYNETASVELDWDDDSKLEIAYMCLRELGVNIEKADIYGYANNMIKENE